MEKLSRDYRRGLKHKLWSQHDMEEAIKLIRSGVLSISEASREFNVPRNTIYDRISHKVDDNCQHIGMIIHFFTR